MRLRKAWSFRPMVDAAAMTPMRTLSHSPGMPGMPIAKAATVGSTISTAFGGGGSGGGGGGMGGVNPMINIARRDAVDNPTMDRRRRRHAVDDGEVV